MSWVEEINSLSTDYAPLLNAVSVIWLPLSAAAAFVWFAFKKIKKRFFSPKTQARNLTPEEREIFFQVYTKLSEAKGLVLRDGRVGNEANALFWEARDKARLELPDDIQEYTETLRVAASKAFSINESYLYPANRDGLPVGEERSKKVDEHEENISVIIEAKPHEIFAPYMKVKIS